MDRPLRVLVTGSTCAGKSTTHRAVCQRFGADALGFPEVATQLLNAGFHRSGRSLNFSASWLERFIDSIVPTQVNLEESFDEAARSAKSRVVWVDRGLLDPATFLAEGLEGFLKRYGFDLRAAYARYDVVFILETIAAHDPSLYGKSRNPVRHHTADQALIIHDRTLGIWGGHPNAIVLPASLGLDTIVNKVEEEVRQRLAC